MPTYEAHLHPLRAAAERVAQNVAVQFREEVDRDSRWPAESMRALAEAGLMGLHVPRSLGGHGEGLTALVLVCEALGRECPSSGLCFGMHCVGTAVIAAKATQYQQEHYLRPIAAGRHITTLALSEAGTGGHFYLPLTQLQGEGEEFILEGEKHFVTNGAHADSYVVSVAAGGDTGTGQFSCVLVDRDLPGLSWGDAWHGFGMRGNESRRMRLDRVRVHQRNLLGEVGDQVWYVFEVVAPFFLMAMSGTYLGVAGAALDLATEHLKTRTYSHSGERLSGQPVLQHRLAELWIKLRRTRALVYEAAHLGDEGNPAALVPILAAKADVAEMATEVTNEAMTLCGGAAYAENSLLARYLRDARAAHVMAPTTDMLKTWAGRALLGEPLLQ